MSTATTATTQSALDALDRAIELARRQPARELFKAWLPGLSIAWLALALYYVERVEGVRALRPAFAVAFVAAFSLRAQVLSSWARRRAAALLSPYGVSPTAGPGHLAMRASLWMTFDLWLWLWPLGLAAQLDPWLVAVLWPLLCLRGALAPSWLAVVGTSDESSGLRALRQAVARTEGQRIRGVSCELLLLLGALGLTFNLGAIVALAVTLGQSAMGLDLSFVRVFLSPRNHFALLAVAGLACALIEPVRAALAAVLYSETELSREGAAVRALVERAITPAARKLAAVCLLAGASWAAAYPAQAQDEACEGTCLEARARDEAVGTHVRTILRDSAFSEFPVAGWQVDELEGRSLEGWLERLLGWLIERSEQDTATALPGLSRVELPGAPFFVALAVVLAGLGLWRAVAGMATAPKPPTAAPSADEITPETHLAEAVALYERDPRAALRLLYAGTLRGLERRKLLTLSPERTNGSYVRQLGRRPERGDFAQLTRTFEAVQYGTEPLARSTFERCLEAAQRLVRGGAA